MYVNDFKINVPKSFKDEKHLQKAIVRAIRKIWDVPMIGVSFVGNKIWGKDSTHAARQMQEAYAMGYEKGTPDLIILSPSKGYNFLALEIKLKPGEVFLKRGGFTSNAHAIEQARKLEEYNAEGGLGLFVEGWDMAFNTVQWYFEGDDNKHFEVLTANGKCPYTGQPEPIRVLKICH